MSRDGCSAPVTRGLRWGGRATRFTLSALSALLIACDPPKLPPTSSVVTPPTATWMAEVFAERDDVALGELLLPGAFNASSYACDEANGMSPDAPEVVRALWGSDDTEGDPENRALIVAWSQTQGLSLGTQLQDGIRFIEINLTLKDGEIVTWHSVYGVPLDEILGEVVAFSTRFPDEVVVVTFGLTLDEADWPALTELLLAPRVDGASFCDRVFDGDQDAALVTLGEVRARGRNLIWSPEGSFRSYLETRGDCALSQGTTDRAWSITVSTEGVEAAISASLATRDPGRLLVNDFVFSLDGAASPFEQASYLGEYDGVRDVSEALGFAGDFPTRLIDTYYPTQTDPAGGGLNIFAGAWYQDTELVEAAIAANRAANLAR